MVDYTTRTLPDGSKIQYRKNPPRDENGKVVPTKKQRDQRQRQSRRMKTAHNIISIQHPEAKPGTSEYGKLLSDILTKNMNDSGKKKSRLPKLRAQVCRSGSKIRKCSNITK